MIGILYDLSLMLRLVEELFGIFIYFGEVGANGMEFFAL